MVDLANSCCAFFASFECFTMDAIATPIADTAARIHPTTGMDLIAVPTRRIAPAKPTYAVVAAVTATVSAPVAAAFAVIAAVSAVNATPD